MLTGLHRHWSTDPAMYPQVMCETPGYWQVCLSVSNPSAVAIMWHDSTKITQALPCCEPSAHPGCRLPPRRLPLPRPKWPCNPDRTQTRPHEAVLLHGAAWRGLHNHPKKTGSLKRP